MLERESDHAVEHRADCTAMIAARRGAERAWQRGAAPSAALQRARKSATYARERELGEDWLIGDGSDEARGPAVRDVSYSDIGISHMHVLRSNQQRKQQRQQQQQECQQGYGASASGINLAGTLTREQEERSASRLAVPSARPDLFSAAAVRGAADRRQIRR